MTQQEEYIEYYLSNGEMTKEFKELREKRFSELEIIFTNFNLWRYSFTLSDSIEDLVNDLFRNQDKEDFSNSLDSLVKTLHESYMKTQKVFYYLDHGKYVNEFIDLYEQKFVSLEVINEIKKQFANQYNSNDLHFYQIDPKLIRLVSFLLDFIPDQKIVEFIDWIMEKMLDNIKTKSAKNIRGLSHISGAMIDNRKILDDHDNLLKLLTRNNFAIYKYRISNITKKNILLERVKRINLFHDSTFYHNEEACLPHYKYSFKISREDSPEELGESIYLISDKDHYGYFPESLFQALKPKLLKLKEVAKALNELEHSDSEDYIMAYYQNIYFKKAKDLFVVEDSEEELKQREAKIEKLKQEFLDLEVPTNQSLLEKYLEDIGRIELEEDYQISRREEILEEIDSLINPEEPSDKLANLKKVFRRAKEIDLNEDQSRIISLINEFFYDSDLKQITFPDLVWSFRRNSEITDEIQIEKSDLLL
jgi:hypothetical protein